MHGESWQNCDPQNVDRSGEERHDFLNLGLQTRVLALGVKSLYCWAG